MQQFFSKWKLRRLKLRVWNRRIEKHLHYIRSELNPLMDCSSVVYWGQFYGGSIIVDRRLRSAKIMIQIPYDGYLSANEKQVLNQYSIKETLLPYFIFYHEAAHLLEMMPYIEKRDLEGLKWAIAENRDLASKASSSYRDLTFEEKADRYAYEMLTKNCRPTG
ncbi:hypothetical protein ABE504_16365 [Paenibacillus oryzisoli]|uniref:hypothetical protein n=1 Tax=Paenibacillus oryzisoli TaxID=1850517 RepID=UPI003D2963E1